MARNAQLFVDYSAEFAEPGNYDVTFTIAAPGDTAPDNDTLNRVIVVRPFNDIAVAGSLDMADLFGGQSREKTFTVTTDRRALAQRAVPGQPCAARTERAGSFAPASASLKLEIVASMRTSAESAISPTCRRSPACR